MKNLVTPRLRFSAGLLPAALLLLTISCGQETVDDRTTEKEIPTVDSLLSKEALADKVLGLLIGSAIGDAMGAPTEMWDRLSIRMEYGHVDSLDQLVREASPEGPWAYNLPPGGTTDDTRWKVLVADYLSRRPAGVDTLDARAFGQHIVQTYIEYIKELKATESFSPTPFEAEARRMTWLQEWALVARPYVEGDYEAYIVALNRFYGGDMACAGLLYAPMIGLYYPGKPALAYREGYRLAIFDHGYARDISALSAALTAAAAAHRADPEQSLAVIREIDPYGFFESRLLGRSAYRIYREARSIAYDAAHHKPTTAELAAVTLPAGYTGTPEDFLQRERAFELLDPRLQDAPFHAGEIWLVTLTGILLYDWEFMPALEFIVNYGRDNDTSGAVAGALLGAYHGAGALPADLTATILEINRETLGIDLEEKALELTEAIWTRHPGS